MQAAGKAKQGALQGTTANGRSLQQRAAREQHNLLCKPPRPSQLRAEPSATTSQGEEWHQGSNWQPEDRTLCGKAGGSSAQAAHLLAEQILLHARTAPSTAQQLREAVAVVWMHLEKREESCKVQLGDCRALRWEWDTGGGQKRLQ